MHVLDRPLRRLASSKLVAAATWPHGVDGYAGLVAPTFSTEEVRARISHIDRQTADTVTLSLRPNGNWTGHRAGQHVVLTVEVEGIRRSRCFSVASAEGVDELELTCKVGPTSVVARHLREHAAVGDVLTLSPAQGAFVLPAERPAALLLVSAGSGITPVLSMVRTLTAEGYAGSIRFLHYARSGDDVLYVDELRSLPGVDVVIVTEDDQGRFDPSHLGATADAAYVCGPAPFMDLVEAAWLARGGAPTTFHTERFSAPVATPGEAGGTLRFSRSGVEVANDGRSILEQAEDAGLTPTSGCRMGICHTCVRPASAGCLSEAGAEPSIADGSPVRICVSAPAGDLTIDL